MPGADHIENSKGLTSAPYDAAIRATFLGQAHIAGTGPEGKTCRECIFWHAWTRVKVGNEYETRPAPPSYFSFRHVDHPGELKRARCNFPIINKAKRSIPHHASACSKFDPAEAPLPAKLDPPPAKPKREPKTRSRRK